MGIFSRKLHVRPTSGEALNKNPTRIRYTYEPVACRGGANDATAPGIHPGGIQGASFLKKNVGKWQKRREKCRYRGMMQHWGHPRSEFSLNLTTDAIKRSPKVFGEELVIFGWTTKKGTSRKYFRGHLRTSMTPGIQQPLYAAALNPLPSHRNPAE